MKIILDILVLVVIALSVLLGVKKGFIKTVIGLVGMLIVLLLTWRLSTPLGGYIDTKLINPSLRSSAASSIAEKIGVELQEGDEEIQLEAFEEEISAYNEANEGGISLFGVGSEALKEATSGVKEGIVDAVFSLVDKVSVGVSNIIAIVVLFIVLSLLMYVVKLLITPLLKMLRIKKLDSLLGGLLGFARGIIIVLLIGFAVKISAPLIEDKLPPSEINSTVVFKYAYQIMGGEKA